jgi:hypothetical protein
LRRGGPCGRPDFRFDVRSIPKKAAHAIDAAVDQGKRRA